MKYSIFILFFILISCDFNQKKKVETHKKDENTITLKTDTKKVTEKVTEIKNGNIVINNIEFIQDENVKIGIIIDNDGYSNLRTAKKSKSKIIRRINETELFFYKPNSNNWYLVKDLLGNIGYIHKSRIKETNTDNFFNIKTFLPSEKDTIIETHSISRFYEFGLNAKEYNGNINSNETVIFNLNYDFKILIEKTEFNKNLHTIEFNKKSKHIIEKIDGKIAYGAEYLPEYEVSVIKLIQDKPKQKTTEFKISNLYNPNFRDSRIYKTNNDRIIIWLELGENSSAMSMIIIIKNNKIIDKIKYVW